MNFLLAMRRYQHKVETAVDFFRRGLLTAHERDKLVSTAQDSLIRAVHS